tara:strand:- start:1155 stop:1352 length:198 start_codon:yes stop_codon:yes gene_type:complete
MKKNENKKVLPSRVNGHNSERIFKWSFQKRDHTPKVEEELSSFEYFFGNVLNKINYSYKTGKIKD